MYGPAFVLSALATFASARKCTEVTVPVSITARTAVFGLNAPATQIDVTNFILDLTRNGHNLTAEALKGYTTKNGDYVLAGTFCTPDKGPQDTTVQLLTHGIGFDRHYWDFSANNYNYSYVWEAVDQYGFSTFAWDRLGVGMSSHGEPVNEIQASLELAALKALTYKLHHGTIAGVGVKFKKVVHVGHSFGSALSYTFTQQNPRDSAGLILTGFTNNSTFVPYFALGGNFQPAAAVPALAMYPAGYFAAGDIQAAQTNFFAPNQFDPAVLTTAFATGQPVTVGELLTVGGGAALPNPYTGPVLIITGGRDLPFCGGDCLATGDPAVPSILDKSKKFFPAACTFKTFVVPNAGHGLNLEYSHPLTYSTINDFVVTNVGQGETS